MHLSENKCIKSALNTSVHSVGSVTGVLVGKKCINSTFNQIFINQSFKLTNKFCTVQNDLKIDIKNESKYE